MLRVEILAIHDYIDGEAGRHKQVGTIEFLYMHEAGSTYMMVT